MFGPRVYYTLLSVLSSFAIILTRKRVLIALLLLSSWCFVTVSGSWLFPTMPSVVVCDCGVSYSYSLSFLSLIVD